MMGNRHLVRRCKALRVAFLIHCLDFLAIEPTRVLEFDGVDFDFLRTRFRQTTDHQRRRKRPRLGSDITHAVAFDSAFLVDFPFRRLFDRLARLDESGERGIHALRESPLPTHQTALAIERQHDDDGVGAWKMLRLAGAALPPPPGGRDLSRNPADGAETVARMPIEDGFGLAEDRRHQRRNPALQRDRAQIDELQIVATGHDQFRPIQISVSVGLLFDCAVGEASGENRRAIGLQSKQGLDPRAAQSIQRRQRKQNLRRFVTSQDRHFAADYNEARVRALTQTAHGLGIVAQFGDAVERFAGKGKAIRAAGGGEKGVFHHTSLKACVTFQAARSQIKFAGESTRLVYRSKLHDPHPIKALGIARRGG